VTRDSRELEILVAKIQGQLAPDAEVVHDAKLKGRHSKRERQIDVLVRKKIGQYEMLIVLDCKDYARPVDVKGVEEFHGLLTDVGAHKGALVSPRGFTPAAKTRAKGLHVDLYSPIDTEPHKWQARVTAPIVCDFRRAKVSFRVGCSAPKPFRTSQDFYSKVAAFDGAGKELGLPVDAAIKKWNSGLYPFEPGEHRNLAVFDATDVLMDNGYGERVRVTLTVSLRVEQQLYFGELPVERISGFKDELAGDVITKAFTTGILDLDEVLREWQPINSEADLPMPPVGRLRALIGLALP
jgi:Restriction endonuclease